MSNDLKPSFILKVLIYVLLIFAGFGIIKLMILFKFNGPELIIFIFVYLGILITEVVPDICCHLIAKWIQKSWKNPPSILFFDNSTQQKEEYAKYKDDTKDNPTLR
jgi:hypothetical protein